MCLFAGSADDEISECHLSNVSEMRFIICSPMAWHLLSVDISDLDIPVALFQFLKLRWKLVSKIVVNAEQEHNAAA